MTESVVKYDIGTDRGEQLEIPFVTDSNQVSVTNVVTDRNILKQQAIQRYLDRAEKEPLPYIEKYSPGKRQTEYYRLSYRLGKKVKHIHIRGGSVISDLANYRAKKLQAMIDRGAELAEVLAAVRTFNNG